MALLFRVNPELIGRDYREAGLTEINAGLHVSDLTRRFGGREVVSDVSLVVAPGQVTCLLGPSGCGKSTTLRLIAGIDRQDKGRVAVDGRVLSDARLHNPPETRSIGLMFQDFALFPHLSVADNIGFGLVGSASEKTARVREMLERVRLTEFQRAYPHELSGGEQQRVAVARALVNKPDIVLADEPTGNLDQAMSQSIQTLLRRLNKEHGQTFVIVTHDREFAAQMDRAISLVDGQVSTV